MTARGGSVISFSRYIVGIDLGTTNSAVNYLDGDSDDPTKIRVFDVPQLVSPGQVTARPLLPSFLYLPAPGELEAGGSDLPWAKEVQPVVGEMARERGARVPSRLVSSAKSWLCHGEVDRRAALLPVSAAEGVDRVSPVVASRLILEHMVRAWNFQHASHPLEDQEVVLTVPASFDATARTLTEEAARGAGFRNLTLIEEPQAAFYAWVAEHGEAWKKALPVGHVVLICDIGGGTTDFSLIVCQGTPEGPRPVRVAVGDHLLVGGDNFDLTLAHRMEAQLLGPGRRLDAARFLELAHACRHAKETLFTSAGEEAATVSILGTGAKVVGGTLSTRLPRKEMIDTLMEGFFPPCAPTDRPAPRSREGFQEFGLPYVTDPRITRHIASFLIEARPAVEGLLGPQVGLEPGMPVRPDVVLFNGGAIKPGLMRARILGVLGGWFEAMGLARPRGLMNKEADQAVAQGAVYYGLVRRGHGIRIHGGAPRSYYIGLGHSEREMLAGEAEDLLLVAPRGMQEGEKLAVPGPALSLRVGRLAAFPLFASTKRLDETVGQLVKSGPDFQSLAPLSAVLSGPHEGRKVKVRLESRLTETGSLELMCHSLESDEHWTLSFSLRQELALGLPGETRVTPKENLRRSVEILKAAFGKGPPGSPKPGKLIGDVMAHLERELGKKRLEWPGPTIRILSETLEELRDERAMSDAHEARYLHLVGFFLRPGLGMPGDEKRMDRLWQLFDAGVKHKKAEAAHREWWVMWRRVAPGLDQARQQALFDYLKPHIDPTEPRRRGLPKEALGRGAIDQMWRLAGSLERLPAAEKTELGERLLKEIGTGEPREFAMWTLARLGARVPLCGAAGEVVSADVAQQWIHKTLKHLRKLPDQAGFALAEIGRRTGDRHRDLAEGPRRDLVGHLTRVGVSPALVTMVTDIVPVGIGEMARLLGDALPVGLELSAEDREHLGGVTGVTEVTEG